MNEVSSGSIRIRKNGALKAGQLWPGHTHNFDHTTIVFSGGFHVKVEDAAGNVVVEKDFYAPAHFLVKAEYRHTFKALEDGSEFWCVYSHRTPQGEISEIDTGFYPGYQ